MLRNESQEMNDSASFFCLQAMNQLFDLTSQEERSHCLMKID